MSIIAICSDSHDNMPNIKKFLNYCKQNKIKTILHCGDITSLQTFNYIQENFDGGIFAVLGNADMVSLEKKQILEIDNLKIGLAHIPKTARKLLQENKNLDFVFYGHTHKPWIEKIDSTYFANPGTLAGLTYRATFAVLDTKTKKMELKLLDNL